MPLNSQQLAALSTAISEYSYPKVLFDFVKSKEIRYMSMRELETDIRRDQISGNPDDVKRGLSNVLYWGHRTTGFCKTRVEKFREQVTARQLSETTKMLVSLQGAGLLTLKGLKLPEFSNVSFLSKLRMFLDPDKWVVLDRNLMNLADLNPNTVHLNYPDVGFMS